MIGLTARQRELLTYLREREHPPTYRQMANALGLSAKSGAWRLVRALHERGYVAILPGGDVYVTEFPATRLRVVFGPEELDARAVRKRHLWAQREAA